MASRKKSPPSIRLVESAAAELRLVEARAFIHDRIARGPLWLVGPSRGSVDDLARSVAPRARRRDRPASIQRRAARGAAGGAVLAGARHRAGVVHRRRSGRGAGDVRTACGSSPISGRWPATPGFPACPRPHPARAAAGARRRPPPRRPCRSAVRTRAAARAIRGAVRRGVGHRSRDAVRGGTAAVQPDDDRELPLLLLDVPMDSAVEFELVAQADPRPRPTCSSPCRSAISRRSGTSNRSADVAVPTILEPAGASRTWSRAEAVSSSRPASRRTARRPGTCVCSRPRAKGASASRSPGASSTKRAAGVPFDEMAVLVRSPQRLRRPARARVRARGHPGLVRSRHRPPASRPAARSWPCSRAPSSGSRRARFAEYLSLSQVPDGAACREHAPTVPPPVDDLFSGSRASSPPATSPMQPADTDAAAPRARRSSRSDVPVVDGTLRAPWKWENADRRVGGDRRRPGPLAPAARRPRPAVSPAVDGGGARGSRLAAAAANRARRAQPGPPARLRAAGHRRARRVAGGARPGASGWPASKRSRRGCCGGRRASCACSAS